jgi:Transposase IS66 family
MNLPDINLETITDPATRHLIGQLLNVIEALQADIAKLQVENQQLRDENARLKGGSGKPDIKPPIPPASTDHSSEAERRVRVARGKPKKNATLIVTRDEPCRVDPALLPPDAIRHGTTETIVQELVLKVEVIRFVREVWLVPRTGQTITAPLPPGYHGAFGPQVHATSLSLAYDAQVSQPALRRFLTDVGLQIGVGTIARWLADAQARWHAEAVDIQQAGLASGPWQATDQTPTRVDGHHEWCHVLGNALFTVYQTRPGGTRQDVLAVLWGQEPVFRMNDDALAWLRASALSPALVARVQAALPWEHDLCARDLTDQLAQAGIGLGAQQRQLVWDGLAVAAYHAQTSVPIIRQLLSDDARVYRWLVDDHGRCWVHDGRHYAKLAPVVPLHQELLAAFRHDYWAYYRDLLAYRISPSPPAAERLRARFRVLFRQHTGYAALDERIAKTAANESELLLVLDHPDLPLHNNAMELAARRRVRKRDVSFGPQSRVGARAWDTFQTIIATAAKLGVQVSAYFRDRLMAPATTPSLADRIRQRTSAPALPSAP